MLVHPGPACTDMLWVESRVQERSERRVQTVGGFPGMKGGSCEANPEFWPAGLPSQFRVADAIETVATHRDQLASDHAAELVALAVNLLPAEWHAAACADPGVVNAWPWGAPSLSHRVDRRAPAAAGAPAAVALLYLLSHARLLPSGEIHPDHPPERRGLWRAAVQWARTQVRWPEGDADEPLMIVTWGGRRWHPAALTALYLHLVSRSPLAAAGEARRQARELVEAANPGPAHFAAVVGVLDSYIDHPLAAEALKSAPRRGEYAGRLLAEARRVVAAVFRDAVSDDVTAQETAETDGGRALLADARFAAVLRAGDLRGKTVLAMLNGAHARLNPDASGPAPSTGTPRVSAGALYALWLEQRAGPDGPAPRWLWQLARELWESVWRAALEEDRERERRRGMYSGVAGILTLAASRAITATFDVERMGELRGEQLLLFTPGRRAEVARIELARIDMRIHERLVELLAEAPPAVDGLFTLALHRGFERWREMPRDGLGDGDILIDGGKRGLGALLGCGDKDTDYALTWGQCLNLPDIDVKGLWTWNGTYQHAAPGRAAVGMLSIQRALLPGAEQGETGKGRYFAPWTGEPPLPADRSQRRAALHFWRRIGVRMAEVAAEGRLTGGRAMLPVSVVEHEARVSGEPRWQERRAKWVDAGALDVDGDGWRYGPLFDAERQLLERNQQIQNSAAAGGRKRAQNADRTRDGAFTSRSRPKNKR